MRRVAVIIVSVSVALVLSGCVQIIQPGPAKPASGSLATTKPGTLRDSLGVVVPDVSQAMASRKWTTSYEQNPEAIAAEILGYASGIIEGAGLKPDVQLQSVEESETQEPAAGARVPPGTVVHVRIRFGD